MLPCFIQYEGLESSLKEANFDKKSEVHSLEVKKKQTSKQIKKYDLKAREKILIKYQTLKICYLLKNNNFREIGNGVSGS